MLSNLLTKTRGLFKVQTINQPTILYSNPNRPYKYFSIDPNWVVSEYANKVVKIPTLDFSISISPILKSSIPLEAKFKAIQAIRLYTTSQDLELFKRTDYFVFATSHGNYCLHIMDAQTRAKIIDSKNYTGTSYMCKYEKLKN